MSLSKAHVDGTLLEESNVTVKAEHAARLWAAVVTSFTQRARLCLDRGESCVCIETEGEPI